MLKNKNISIYIFASQKNWTLFLFIYLQVCIEHAVIDTHFCTYFAKEVS
jgi:hypothetical protein